MTTHDRWNPWHQKHEPSACQAAQLCQIAPASRIHPCHQIGQQKTNDCQPKIARQLCPIAHRWWKCQENDCTQNQAWR
eukprot:6967245-Karenia_brevis.AAC.1